jgi:hypothetical protein
MKTLILKILITKKGFFDREKLVNLSEQSVFKISKNYYKFKVCKLYKKFIKSKRIRSKIIFTNPQMIYQNAVNKTYGEINFFSKIKRKLGI